jgi:hypothetical protein
VCQATDFNLAHRVRQQAGSYRDVRFGVDLGQFCSTETPHTRAGAPMLDIEV